MPIRNEMKNREDCQQKQTSCDEGCLEGEIPMEKN